MINDCVFDASVFAGLIMFGIGFLTGWIRGQRSLARRFEEKDGPGVNNTESNRVRW